MPVGVRQFTDGNGKPLVSGWVAYAQVGTGGATLRNVYADEGETTPLQNPVPLDASGRPYSGGSQVSIWGDGTYEEYVYDSSGVLQTSSIIDTQSAAATTQAATGDGAQIGAATIPGEGTPPRVFRQRQQLGSGLNLPLIQGGLATTDDNGYAEIKFDSSFTALSAITCTHYNPSKRHHEAIPISITDFSASGFVAHTHHRGHRHEFFWLAMGT